MSDYYKKKLKNYNRLTRQFIFHQFFLGGISNIVINDEVGAAVNDAYENLLLTKQYFSVNDIYNATFYAKKAFIASEVAFFHPSMLALLYFPDDQK